MRRQSRLYFPNVEIRSGVLALFAVAMQGVAIFIPLGMDDAPKRLLFELSYLVLLFFIVVNLPRPGFVIIGIGLLLNLLPIVANGGLMPITPEAVVSAGQAESIEGLTDGDAIPYSKNVLMEEENTHFYQLSDRIAWNSPIFIRAFSIGDLVIAAGLLVMLADLFLPRMQRATRGPTGPWRANP